MNFKRCWRAFSWLISLSLALAGAARAATVYTNETDFVAAIGASQSSLNEFSRLTAPMQYSHPLSFAQNGMAYAITTIPEFELFWIAGGISTAETGDIIRVGFGSDNVHAVGGWCYLTDTNGTQIEGTLTLVLSDGTTNTLSATSNPPSPFCGFISSGTLITWMTLHSETSGAYPTLDHFYVAEGVPSLAVSRSTTNTVELSWPAPSTGYSLQTKLDLPGTEWTTTAVPVQPVGDRLRVTIPMSNVNARFRLIKP